MRSLFTADGWTLSGYLDGLDQNDPEVVYFIDQQAQYPAGGRDERTPE